MKKIRVVLICAIFALLPLLSACSSEEIEHITERFFVQQVSNIMFNLDNYTGRTIQLEGMFFGWSDYFGAEDVYYFVVRFLSGCCGGGGNVGFEVYMGNFEPFADDTWVSVTGVLEIRDGWMQNAPMLVVTAIEALDVRGQEIVFQ